ncbi:hypothetical protein [Chryseobacterium flavum]|uniref:hypothetical protein n=2 Tax=Chryseobacterium flavum TaxID=415851 RepID=UPI0028AA7C50|nr:hypothetical protein [Chryseobacterium flavum]
MNSRCINTEHPQYVQFYQTLKHKNMETTNHNPDIIFDEDLYTIEWSDIENAEMDYENYLNDIENFFRQDFENDIFEEDTL